MKNLKKVLALVLAFACAFTMFAGAVVYPDVPAGSEYSEAITMLSDLGIIQGKDDGKYHSEDTITRAEACALIARMLTGDPQVSQYAGASNFTDVVKGSWKESVVGYCVVNGITVGVGNNKFEPDRAITDAEFVTMVVRAMGYETTGTSYPYGHISAAQANGLLDDVTVVPSSAALRGEDAQIIYNALFADYARGAKQVNTTHGTTVEEYPTIAEDVFGLTRAAVGTWDKNEEEMKTCKAHTWVITGVLCEKGEVKKIKAYPIKDDSTDIFDAGKTDADKDVGYFTFTYEGNIDGLKGYQVELWGEGQHSEPEYDKTTKAYAYSDKWEIKAIKTVKGQSAYDYNATMSDGKNNDEIKLDGVTLDVDKNVEKALNVKNGYSYKLIDWDSDDEVDYIKTDKVEYLEVVSVSKSKVKFTDELGSQAATKKVVYTLDVDGETDGDDATGKAADADWAIKAELPEDLEEGDVVAVTKSCEGAKKEIVSTWTVELVEPESMEVTDVDTKKGVAFDGEYINVADEKFTFEDTYDVYDKMDEDTDDAWDVWTNANGYVIKLAESDETYSGYIFVTGADNGSNKTGDRGLAEISGVTDKNEYLEDVKLVKDADVGAYYNEDTRAFSKNPKGLAFKYKMNDDGQITKMIQVATTKANDYEFIDKTDAFVANGAKNWADKASVIFAVKVTTGTKGEYHDNGYASGLKAGDTYKVGGTDLDKKNVMAVAYDEIPDICLNQHATGGHTEKTVSYGATYDRETKNDNLEAAVLGVDTFRFFSNTTVKAALVTKMTYHKSSDTYTLDANVAGEDATEFDTVDADDVYVNGVANQDDVLNKMYDKLSKTNPVYGIYCEIELDKDGKVIALTEMDQAVTGDKLGALSGREIKKNPSYQAVRAVVNKVTADKSLTVTAAVANGDNKVYTVENAQYTQAFDLKDDTAFFKITDEKVELPAIGETLVTTDGFKKGFGVEEGSVDDLDSYIDNTDDEDEYVVADVIVDGDDVVAVYYYEKTVEEVIDVTTLPQLKVSDNVDDVFMGRTYGTIHSLDVAVTCTAGEAVDFDDITVTAPDDVQGITIAKSTVTGKTINVKLDGTTPVGAYKYTVSMPGHRSATFTVNIVAYNITPDITGNFNAGTYNTTVSVQVNNADLAKLVGTYNLKGVGSGATMNVPTLKEIKLVSGTTYELVLDTAGSTYIAVAGNTIAYSIAGNYTATITLAAA
ncbi:S-layer homology domain-containing protein [Butyricicoccus pullicaecorum]|nr:S-layer homology domain-containing protein [Butyricicoccus pullicaecorum]